MAAKAGNSLRCQCEPSSQPLPPILLSTSTGPHALSKHPLRANNLPLPPTHLLARASERDGQGLERRLRPVMVVLAPEHVQVQGDAGRLAEALDAVRQHLGREGADALVGEAKVHDGKGAGGDVDDGAGEGFVQGRVRVREAAETGAGAERLRERGAEGEKGVFGGVVVVDWGRR